jgi:AMME syndrome candidate gene 1 protein
MKQNNDDKAVQDGPPLSGTTTTTTTISSLSAPSSSSTSYQNHAVVTVSDTEESNLIATPSMCYHCFDTLIDTLQHTTNKNSNSNNNNNSSSSSSNNNHHKRTNASTSIPNFASQDLPDGATTTVECPIFVTWEISAKQSNHHHTHHSHTHRWQLRGCIGTLTPRLLSTAVGEYAVMSALKDKRFRPIELHEVSSLRVSISLLVQYEECQDVYDWTVGVHGIVIKFSMVGSSHNQHNKLHHRHYNATYLPEVAAQLGWDQSQTILSLIQKAGYHGTVTADFLKTIHCTRYQSSKCQVTFDEYVLHNCQGKDPLTSRPHHKARQSPSSSSSSSSWTSSSCINM